MTVVPNWDDAVTASAYNDLAAANDTLWAPWQQFPFQYHHNLWDISGVGIGGGTALGLQPTGIAIASDPNVRIPVSMVISVGTLDTYVS